MPTKTATKKEAIHIPEKVLTPKGQKKKAEYLKLMKGVIADSQYRVNIEALFESKYGKTWFSHWDDKTDADFQTDVYAEFLQAFAGPEHHKFLTDDFRKYLIVEPVSANNEHQVTAKTGTQVTSIDLIQISPSPLEPQQRRRKTFKQYELEELAASIKSSGLMQPITVRPVHFEKKLSHYEIVFGERRFLASKIAGLIEIDCIVRDLTDNEATEIQIQENIQRKDLDPLDEAFAYKYLMEHSGMTIHDLAIRFGRSEKNIAHKLTLNNLIPEVVELLASGELPLGHAVEIAKYPAETQKVIVDEEIAYRYGDKDDGVLPLKEFKEELRDEILLELASAPFDTEDPRLRPDGLICPDCPQRTGFSPLLFTEDLEKGDRCLNKSCFELKTQNHFQIQREAAALLLPNPKNLPLEEQAKKVPFVSENYTFIDVLGEKVLPHQKIYDSSECDHATPAIIADGKREGECAFICKNDKCKVHNQGNKQSTSKNESSEYDLQRKEREFQVKVGMTVRHKVLREAIENGRYAVDEFQERLLSKLWFSCGYDTRSSIAQIINDWEGFPKKDKHYDKTVIENFIASLDQVKKSQFLFLLVFADEGFMSYSYASQDGVIELAQKYTDIDYKVLDAEVRVELAPEEFKNQARTFLFDVNDGRDVQPPNFWWSDKT